MRIFEKSCKIAEASGSLPPNPRWPTAAGGSDPRPRLCALLLSPTAIAFVEHVSSVGRTLLLRKITDVTHSKYFHFAFSALSSLLFTSNSAVFLMGGKNIFAPGRLVP